jgi:hypothetical protein
MFLLKFRTPADKARKMQNNWTLHDDDARDVGACNHGTARPLVADGGTASRYGEYLQIYSISSCRQPTKGGAPAWLLGEVLKILTITN